MASHRKPNPDWKQFERLVARIEADAGPLGLKVLSPDRIPCKITGRLREVDASVRTTIGTTNVLITIECRKRRPKQDVTWIEQLATKKHAIGASRTIAVSSSGFSDGAVTAARYHGIDLRRLTDVSTDEINRLMRLDFVLFTHKRCALARVALRFFRSSKWSIPDQNKVDLILPRTTDTRRHIFKNTKSAASWSLNDLWLQLQQATDPFSGIAKGCAPVVRTACFPYPGNVTIRTPKGPRKLGDVLLSVALWLEVEQVTIDEAKKIEYAGPDGRNIQRIEFASKEAGAEEWRISLQMPKGCTDLKQIKTGGNWPNRACEKGSVQKGSVL